MQVRTASNQPIRPQRNSRKIPPRPAGPWGKGTSDRGGGAAEPSRGLRNCFLGRNFFDEPVSTSSEITPWDRGVAIQSRVKRHCRERRSAGRGLPAMSSDLRLAPSAEDEVYRPRNWSDATARNEVQRVSKFFSWVPPTSIPRASPPLTLPIEARGTDGLRGSTPLPLWAGSGVGEGRALALSPQAGRTSTLHDQHLFKVSGA